VGFAMNVKNQWLYGILYVGIAMNEKNQRLYGILYVGIAMNVKNQRLLCDPICRYYNEYKKPTTIMGSYMRVLQCMYKTNGY
jgi:hypothetical protein